MTKRTSAKHKLDRRMGENIWGRPKSPVNRREYGPGQHGQRRKGKISDFGIQLRAKQKLKGYYGDLTEKQFRRIYGEAERVKGDTGENLIGLLERRLDAVVYRAKFVATVFAARQFVNHGHVRVNGKKVNIPSYRVKEGDVIEVRDRSKQMAALLEATQLSERRTGSGNPKPSADVQCAAGCGLFPCVPRLDLSKMDRTRRSTHQFHLGNGPLERPHLPRQPRRHPRIFRPKQPQC